MPTTILLIRHGETAWNRARIFRGLHDVPLNENGHAQARHIADALALRAIDAAYTSPLPRASETAHIVLQPHGIAAVVHQGLTDFDYGEWTGLEDQVVAPSGERNTLAGCQHPHQSRPPRGDTLQEVLERALTSLEELAQKHTDTDYVVVSLNDTAHLWGSGAALLKVHF